MLRRGAVRAREREAYDAVLVDEYQDTDPAQEELLAQLAGDGLGDPALRSLAQHDGLGIEPPALVEETTQLATALAILLDCVFIVFGSSRDPALCLGEPTLGDISEPRLVYIPIPMPRS